MATINGTSGPDHITGTIGDDQIFGGLDIDVIEGLAGNDLINGGTGGNFFEIDMVTYRNSPTGVVVNLAAGTASDGWGGTDTLQEIESVDDSSHDDSITGDANENWIHLNNGGTDFADGGDGFDILFYEGSHSGVTINLDTGVSTDAFGNNDTTINFEAAHGSSFSDHITLTDGNNHSFGRAGNDTILGLDGDDFLIGGSGDDILDGGAGAFDAIDYFDDGVESVFGGPPGASQGAYVDLANGFAIDGWGNTDSIVNVEGVHGSQFDDTILGNMGTAAGNGLFGHDGNDVIHNGGTNFGEFDFIDGGSGDDILTGKGGVHIVGGAGNDLIRAEYHNDPDIDFIGVRYDSDPSGIVANLTGSMNGGLAGGSHAGGFLIADGYGGIDNVAGFHMLMGSEHGDQIFVDSTFQSSFGNWIEVRPLGGDDMIVFDQVAVARISYSSSNAPVYADMEAGIARDLHEGDTAIGSDTFIGANQFRGSQGGDVIFGALGDDQRLRGQDGDDEIDGRAGNDHVEGENGNDTLRGGLGNDQLLGGSGNDTLIDNGTEGGGTSTGPGKGLGHLKGNGKGHEKHEGGGVPGHDMHHGGDLLEDNDVYTGGGGHDTFVFLANNGHDAITDFSAGAGSPDVIDLSAWALADFDALLALADDQGGMADVVFTLDEDNSLTLNELRIADLHADDFLLA